MYLPKTYTKSTLIPSPRYPIIIIYYHNWVHGPLGNISNSDSNNQNSKRDYYLPSGIAGFRRGHNNTRPLRYRPPPPPPPPPPEKNGALLRLATGGTFEREVLQSLTSSQTSSTHTGDPMCDTHIRAKIKTPSIPRNNP